MLNQVSLIGRLACDPKINTFSSGVKKADMIIAVERNYKNSDGERETDFVTVTAWRKLAQHCEDYLEKGRLIAIEGRIEVNSWKDKETGDKKYRTGVLARNIQFLDRSNESEREETA